LLVKAAVDKFFGGKYIDLRLGKEEKLIKENFFLVALLSSGKTETGFLGGKSCFFLLFFLDIRRKSFP